MLDAHSVQAVVAFANKVDDKPLNAVLKAHGYGDKENNKYEPSV